VIPNPFDNTLLIQGTPQDYESIKSLLQQLDVPPRQVLIDAKIYEVDLTSAYGAGVSAFLQNRTDTLPGGTTANLVASSAAGALNLTTGAIVMRSKELLLSLTANDSTSYAKVVSAPTIIATDSVPAVMNVGVQVPVLTSTVATGVQSGGNTDFANTISSQSTGITLNIMAHVNPSGIVTMQLEQQYSAPQAAPAGVTTASPSFSNRSIATQLTVQDGDTVALGGAILEQDTIASSGIPFLNRIPVLGLLFGAKSVQKSRTEMIVFLTPRVIYDTSQLVDASEELKSTLKRVSRDIKDNQ
jgi:general secretion pathway protein D